MLSNLYFPNIHWLFCNLTKKVCYLLKLKVFQIYISLTLVYFVICRFTILMNLLCVMCATLRQMKVFCCFVRCVTQPLIHTVLDLVILYQTMIGSAKTAFLRLKIMSVLILMMKNSYQQLCHLTCPVNEDQIVIPQWLIDI